MSSVATLIVPSLTIRSMAPRDLRQVLEIGRHSPPPDWNSKDFFNAMYARDFISLVAERRQRIVGFVVCAGSQPGKRIRLVGRIVRSLIGEGAPPVKLDLLNIAVAPDFQQQGVARELLAGVEERLQPGDRVRAFVPEPNLPLQLSLRSAGYQAHAVLKHHFLHDHAYLMERSVA